MKSKFCILVNYKKLLLGNVRYINSNYKQQLYL
nr:MAG TPA: hypothetical protein [Caudoviricetes sp.]